jgi:hypothetical protein
MFESKFRVGQNVRFWSKDECIDHNYRMSNLDVSGQLEGSKHPWDTVGQVTGVAHTIQVRFPGGVVLDVSPHAVSIDLSTEYQLATKVLGEDYFA